MKALLKRIRQILRDRRVRKFFTRFVSTIAAIVVFVTTYALILPAITMEKVAACGIEEHQHDTSCYEDVLTCGLEESDGHRHDDSCYKVVRDLMCEISAHEHGEDCYDENGRLTCTIAEHTHDKNCYHEHRELICGIPESEGHHHDASCYKKVLTCDKEVHVHSTACYHSDAESETSAEDAATAGTKSSIAAGAGTASTASGVVNETTLNGNTVGSVGSAAASTGAIDGKTGRDAGENHGSTESVNAGRKVAADSSTGNDASAAATTNVMPEEVKENLSDGYVPQLDPVNMEAVLGKNTGFYYYDASAAAENGQDIPADSSQITDWKKYKDDDVLEAADILRLYLPYTIPAGTLNSTNQIARYRLPGNIRLDDAQIVAINETENGLAGSFVNYDTLEITDPDKYEYYRGAEAVEGTRKPDQDANDYLYDLVKHGGSGEEYISAVVKAENVFDEKTGDYLGQDLIFIFTPYSIEKNQNEYDTTGKPVKAGEKITGWFACDFNCSQIDWVDADDTDDAGEDEAGTGKKTADVVLVNENKDASIKEISETLILADRGADLKNGQADAASTDIAVDDAAEAKTEAGAEEAADAAVDVDDALDNQNKENKDAAQSSGTAETAEEASNKGEENKDTEYKSGTLTATGDSYKVTLDYTAEAKIPEEARLQVTEITAESDPEAYEACLEEARKQVVADDNDKTTVDAAATRFFDIEIVVEEEGQQKKIEPSAPVAVNIQLAEKKDTDKEEDSKGRENTGEDNKGKSNSDAASAAKSTDSAQDPTVLHFTEEGVEHIEAETSVNETKKDVATEIQFETESFSIYGVVYTVDFHYEVNGKMYQFSLPGGGFVSFEALMEIMGVADKDSKADEQIITSDVQADTDTEVIQTDGMLTVNDIPVSEKTKLFVSDVESVVFSSPEFVWVGKVDINSTVGGLKEANGLECQYSAELTEEQITEINAQTVKAGDWALISVQPFRSEEMLTVTMKNGDQFVVRVTDAQDPSAYIDKEVIIYDNGEQRAMLSGGYPYGGRYRLNSIPLSEAEGNEGSHWTVERHDNNYYLKSSDNRYLTINNNDVGLVNNWSVATPLNIQAGWDPNYRISAANNYNNVLSYSTNANWGDGYFSAPGGKNGTDNQEWLYIQVVETVADRAGDWLLYFDDDFSEITIHVGETISLRPYNKWEWKEGNVNVQTAHWNIGGKDNNYWNQININDANGAHKESWDDGGTGGTAGFHWTAYVKKDDQLDTHYWAVQGQATQAGDYVLTNTKNGKTITVHVVEGSPEPPKTINKIANIKVNLFDYDNGGALDVGLVNGQTNQNLANNNNFKNESVNQMGGSNHFYFLSSGSGNNNDESWNSYTKDRANPNIVKTTLGTDGYPVLDHGNSNTSLKYLFDTSQASQSWHGGSGGNGMIAYPDVVGMFQKDNDGYYYFNSNTNYFYYNTATGTSKLYEHTYTQNSSASKGALANDKPIGFFPFREYNSTEDLYVNQNAALNHHVGLSMELEFMLPRDKKDDNGKDIIFDFSGDDDLWAFVEWVDDNGQKQSKLLLDLGGVHQPIHGDINFTTGSNTTFMDPNRPYTLKVFYLERGGCDSNCSIRFNLPIIQDLNVAKKLTGLTEKEKAKYRNEEFVYEILVNGQPYNYPNSHNRYEKAILRNVDGEDITPENFTITNGRFTLKDGQTLTITYLDRSDRFSVAELKTPNMENFEVPNAERYYHLEHDASLYEEEIQLTASQTESEPITDCWTTPKEKPYELEDTEKVTFTNTLKEKNLEVEKKWVRDQTHPDSITFTVSATVDDGNGGRTPYAVKELKEADGTTDKTFTLNDANHWRHEIEHLPVNTPATPDAPEGKFIFYDINEGHVDGYTLTGIKDITAERYNYCNVDVVKLWPDSNGMHTEVLKVVLKNSEEKYYAGVGSDGKAIFTEDPELASVYELKPENNYTHRFSRVPAGEYTAEQLHEDEYSKGLATYIRNIIQYELENTPLEDQIDPAEETNAPVIHKRIDALRDGVTNPDSAHAGEDLTDLYRLYLDYTINSKQDINGIDLLFVIDHSGSMNNSQWPGNQYRAPAVMDALNGQNGFISKFLAFNDKNRWAAVGFKGPDGSRDYTWSLSNPWQPSTDAATTNAGRNGSEVLSSGNTFNREVANIDLDNEGANKLSNYTAGFWRAEQFLLDQTVKEDGRKKVVVFLTDGVPTLHIDNLNGSLVNAETAAGSPYYREEYGGCPDQASTEFGYFVSDMTGNGYTFGENIEFYTIGLGSSMQTESGIALLNGLLDDAYGSAEHSGHNMTISDSTTSASTVSSALNKDLRIILGMNDTFSNLVIQDDLSDYVDLYGLAAGSSASAIMTTAKAKVTMTVPDPSAPSGKRIVTLYENGAPATGTDAQFTKANGDTATIIKELRYDVTTKTVQAVFDPEYHPAVGVTFTLSFDVKTTDTAYTTYAENGYDKYTSGEKEGQIITGDPDTDFLGTDPANATSVNKPGFRSNDAAKATYTHNNEDEEMEYPHPVIQVAAKADIVKIDQTGAALEGAKFNLYDNNYDPSKTIEENADHLIEADLQSKKPTDPAGNEAVIRDGKLIAGTYYLVETHAPDGFNSLPGPVKITVTETNGVLNMTAEIAGVPIVGYMLQKISNGVWKLQIQNSAGYELPNAGGPGTRFFMILGSILILGAGVLLWRRRRLI